MLGLAGHPCAAGSRTAVHGGEAVYNALTKNSCIAPKADVRLPIGDAQERTLGGMLTFVMTLRRSGVRSPSASPFSSRFNHWKHRWIGKIVPSESMFRDRDGVMKRGHFGRLRYRRSHEIISGLGGQAFAVAGSTARRRWAPQRGDVAVSRKPPSRGSSARLLIKCGRPHRFVRARGADCDGDGQD